MKISWTTGAVHQLAAARDYIAADNPTAADRVTLQIVEQVKHLGSHPQAGRHGRVNGTRELVIVNTPYIVAYRVNSQSEIQVLAILHGKRRWPEVF